MMEFEYFTLESRLIHNDTTIITAEFVTKSKQIQAHTKFCTQVYSCWLLAFLFPGYKFIFT